LDYIHDRDEVVCVLSGEADAAVADGKEHIRRGDRVDVSANTYHSLTVTSEEPLVVLTGMRY
jgi:mannose-6-phosphate isomerase-like protein (cupin superfamily)